jgi:hypothetical protein
MWAIRIITFHSLPAQPSPSRSEIKITSSLSLWSQPKTVTHLTTGRGFRLFVTDACHDAAELTIDIEFVNEQLSSFWPYYIKLWWLIHLCWILLRSSLPGSPTASDSLQSLSLRQHVLTLLVVGFAKISDLCRAAVRSFSRSHEEPTSDFALKPLFNLFEIRDQCGFLQSNSGPA